MNGTDKPCIHMSELVTIDRDAAVATVTLNNPARMNALSRDMRDALTDVMRSLNEDASCRAIVLAGAGEHFSAGADLKDFPEQTVAQCRARLKRGGAMLMREIVAGPKPVIAAVQGYAYGAGLALAAAADHTVAAANARFCCAFTKVAFMPDLAVMYTLPRRVGPMKAKQLIALADVIAAPRALQLGLVDEVVDDAYLLAVAQAAARRYAEAPPLAFELVKSVFAEGLEATIRAEVDLQPMAWLSADHAEGKKAFFEKRPPRFEGK
jgi:2-(1,2-epoxy-1,2-dihydrophenyl)acetyl-CoA isomerase